MNLSPFLLFEGNCAEAMGFYQSCLGGELEVTLLRDTPMKEQAPAHLHDKVAYSRLTSGLIDISATDWQHPTRHPGRGTRSACTSPIASSRN
jgi:PhnB protein